MKKILMILTMALAATSCMDILDVAPEDRSQVKTCGLRRSLATREWQDSTIRSMPPNSRLPSSGVPTV